MDREQIKALIVQAFSAVERPGNWALLDSADGEEPCLVELAFQDKTDWRTLEPAFLDQAPEGYASALSFLSDEAFRYFLPAYLIADLDGALQRVDPAFHLCHGLDDGTRTKRVNRRRFGERTWFDAKRHKFSVFTRAEADAIVEYLRCRAIDDDFARKEIEQAIVNYWSVPGARASSDPRVPTGRPVEGEFAPYAAADIALVAGDDAIEALVRLSHQTRALFLSLAGPAENGASYAPGKWTIKEVLGHLIDDERVFAYRLLCVAREEEKELPGFDENRYASAAGFEQRSLDSLLAEYAAVRAATVALLEALPAAAWARRGRVNGYAASVRGLAFHIAGHELHHHHIIRERYLPRLG